VGLLVVGLLDVGLLDVSICTGPKDNFWCMRTSEVLLPLAVESDTDSFWFLLAARDDMAGDVGLVGGEPHAGPHAAVLSPSAPSRAGTSMREFIQYASPFKEESI